MKLEQNEEVKREREDSEAQSPSRRKFLRSSSATALVTSLSAQPVWGACTVSGALSGASTSPNTVDQCFIPPVIGRSPGFWTDAMYNGNAVISAFPQIHPSRAADLRCYIDNVVKAGYMFTIPTTPPQMFNVGEVLSSPGSTGFINWNLAAIWLDAHFGFFDGFPVPGTTSSDPQDWVNHFYNLSIVLSDAGGGEDAAWDPVFNDASSSTIWNALPAESYCTPDP